TGRIVELLSRAGERDLVFSLISGGGSALMPRPVGGITLEEKQGLTKRLLECGAGIDEINAVRKHISGSKGGQLARLASPAAAVNLMLSDVVGDRVDVIASGPFVPDTSTFEDAWRVLERYSLAGDLPSSIREYLQAGLKGRVPETPKPGDPVFDKVYNCVIGSNILALESAAREAEKRSYKALILSSMIEGETREAAKVHAAIAREVLSSGHPLGPPACIVSGGETTVTIRGKGRGGRNQEFCLAACMEIADLPPEVVILSAGTDGNDGPTDAAGGVVDPGTYARGRKAGMESSVFLNDNDSYRYLEQTGDLLITGPTNTNVMDIRLLLVRRTDSSIRPTSA
ncbi:MAG: glycerate kinase, partial [Desulfobacteraceae bacterium]